MLNSYDSKSAFHAGLHHMASICEAPRVELFLLMNSSLTRF